MEVYWYVNSINDLAIKAECTAWLVGSLTEIDPQGEFESKEGLLDVAQGELCSYIDELLLKTADHYQVAKGAIRALAKSKPDVALKLACSLNLRQRRDRAMLDLVKEIIGAAPSKIDFKFLGRVIDSISEQSLKDHAVLSVVERLATYSKLEQPAVTDALPIINSAHYIRDAEFRCRALCLAYTLIAKSGVEDLNEMKDDLLARTKSAWESIDVGWKRIDAGFKAAAILGESALDAAKSFIEDTNNFRNGVVLDADTPAFTYIGCIQLAIRAFGGLMPLNTDTEDDLHKLSSLIDRVPSNGEKVHLWGEVAMRYFLNKRIADGQRVVNDHIKPLLTDIQDGDIGYRESVTIAVAPALYLNHSTTALEMLARLERATRDEAYGYICNFIIRKHPPSDPYDPVTRSEHSLSYEEAIDVCELIKLMSDDGSIYNYIEKLADGITARRNRHPCSKQQLEEIASRLETIISTKLPDREILNTMDIRLQLKLK